MGDAEPDFTSLPALAQDSSVAFTIATANDADSKVSRTMYIRAAPAE
jgi:hypothetical protein